eukprot:TRINITY_DN21779_c0_g1_i1.p1 TRINITY_DN21779_c0_g1~~TRINITY_DN21779_c0_g1_i1.p1  ORF type:complete len:124 (+),score=10.29 TRINITY_DN21779_c0_g1_i1:246-617(+)
MDNAASALVAAALLHPEDVSKMVELSRTDDADEEDHHNNNSPHPVNNNDDDATSPAAAFKIAEIEERLVDETLLGLQGWWRGRVLWTPLSCRHNGIAPVSYTHLRAHETVLDLVCRLLLEKKK